MCAPRDPGCEQVMVLTRPGREGGSCVLSAFAVARDGTVWEALV